MAGEIDEEVIIGDDRITNLTRLEARQVETALGERLQQLEQRLSAERATAESRIGELAAELERERSERAVAEGSLEAVRKDRAAALARLARYDAGLDDADASMGLESAKAG